MNNILYGSDMTLIQDPVEDDHAATKQYVDAGVNGLQTMFKIVGLGTASQCDYETELSGSATLLPTSEAIKAYIDNAVAEMKRYVDEAIAKVGSGGSTESEITGSETAVPTSAAVKKFVEESLPKLYQVGSNGSPSKLTEAKVGDFYYQKSDKGNVTVGYLSKLPVTGNGSWLVFSKY